MSSKVLLRIDNLDEGYDTAGGDIKSIKDSWDRGMLPNEIVRIIIGAESGPQSVLMRMQTAQLIWGSFRNIIRGISE